MIELRCPVVYQFGEEGWNYYPGTNLTKSASGDVIGSRVYGFDYRGDRTREREYGTAAQASALGNDWTRSRVAGLNADGGLVRYAVYDKKNDNSLDTSLYAYGRDALGKKNFGATGKRDATGDTIWSASRRYTWDGDWVVADSTEVGRRFYAYLGHRRIAEVAEDTSGKWTSRAVLTDHLGTVTGVVGDSGTIEATYQLDPYGNLEQYAGMYQTLYLYTGKEWVSELAGYEFGARVYDPVMGMWWGRDKAAQFWSPWASTGMGLNLMNGVDPNGNDAFGVSVNVSGTLGVVGGGYGAGVIFDTDALLSGNFKHVVYFTGQINGGAKVGIGVSNKLSFSYSPNSPKQGPETSVVRTGTVPIAPGLVGGVDLAESTADGSITPQVSIGKGAEVSGGLVVQQSGTLELSTVLDWAVTLFSSKSENK